MSIDLLGLKLKKILAPAYYLIALLLSFLVVRSFGYPAKLNNVLSVLGLFLFLLGSCVAGLRFLLFACVLLLGSYIPVGLIYGKPNFLIIASVLQTNSSESVEFIKQIPIRNLLLAATFILASWLLIFKLNSDRIAKRRLIAGCLLFTLSFASYAKLFRSDAEARKDILILDLPRTVARALEQYRTEEASFRLAQVRNPWDILGVHSKYKNYVIVIGESVRKDYMSAYGFQQDTTPFAEHANGLFIDGFISPAGNTLASVPRMLAELDGDKVLYGKNIVALAKQAGFKTHWYSNQGYVGEYDSPSSRIAASADDVYFTKWGSSTSKKVDDSALLEKLAEGVKEKQTGSHLFILHLMGSHMAYCDRVRGEEALFSAPSQNMRCYMGSIRRTDAMLSQVHDILKKSNESFSMIYLSDHGLRHEEKGSANETVVHDAQFKQNYAVPFFILSSDADHRTVLKKDMSGFNFASGAANWMGIDVKGRRSYDFFSHSADQNIRVFNGDNYWQFSELKDDPV
ncbi:phosphoethanolamine transferase [Pseudoduganella violacea]|uniref:Glucan phosphoethanolaminetransferase (Alkaline phosphatase superfamily) n=1 Tax=Pseudoduganella violacea TaxID=1715466 RepID=A0A7W5FV35_9BURK|nr:glucan phosphoethanolaminetransferase (alkaline phosphatase superfamily) [Pseudoduganella violacea]